MTIYNKFCFISIFNKVYSQKNIIFFHSVSVYIYCESLSGLCFRCCGFAMVLYLFLKGAVRPPTRTWKTKIALSGDLLQILSRT
ncbi:MAG: hypothetical protein B7X86_05525 [Sphingobacteriales bacterium 17-39-43]|nr:MAG: hypothetical protein B7X86_05525 [Sphingobacteriales bacterium 17-39-43]